jgi:imidazolonepropionase
MKHAEQWDDLWMDARLATMVGPGLGVVEDGAIGVRDGIIVYAGPRADLPLLAQSARVHHNAGRRWITPGLIDCHTHIVYGGNRAAEFEMRLEGRSYAEIAASGGGIVSTVKATREASLDRLVHLASGRLKPLIAEGVVAIESKSGYGLDLESEIKLLRAGRLLALRQPIHVRTTFLGAHALPPEFAGKSDAYIDYLIGTVLPQIVSAGLVDAVDAFLETIGFTYAQVDRLFAAATRMGVPVKLHADQLSDGRGAALAARYQALSADHLEYTSAEGVAAMAKAGTVAVLLPGAFYTLRETKLPPIDALRQAGVKMAVATDSNPGTSPTTSLLLMLNMAATLFRLTPTEALAGVTRNAAAALGLSASHGTLEVGKRADFCVWDIETPAELTYSLGGNPLYQRVWSGQTG